jgi:putative ATP-dependent endonuclease of OLD family
MQLSKVHIQNFRGIANLEIELGATTVLIGENNAGKTSVLDAIRLALKVRSARSAAVFDDFDFHLSTAKATPAGVTAAIQLTLYFTDSEAQPWPTAWQRQLTTAGVLQIDAVHLRSHVMFRVRCERPAALKGAGDGDLIQSPEFLDLSGNVLPTDRRALDTFHGLIASHALPAIRDAARQFDARGTFWRPFLQDNKIDEAVRDKLECCPSARAMLCASKPCRDVSSMCWPRPR